MFEEIIRLYCEYLSADFKSRYHLGDNLANSGRLLLEIDKKRLDNESALQRGFFIKKISADLLKHVENISWTKQYDSAPFLKDYIYLALDLALDYFEFKANRGLIPFLANVLYYENYNESKETFIKYDNLYQQSLRLEQKYIDKLKDSKNPAIDVIID